LRLCRVAPDSARPPACTYSKDGVQVNVSANVVKLAPFCNTIHRTAEADVTGYMIAWSREAGHFQDDGMITYPMQWGKTSERHRFRCAGWLKGACCARLI